MLFVLSRAWSWDSASVSSDAVVDYEDAWVSSHLYERLKAVQEPGHPRVWIQKYDSPPKHSKLSCKLHPSVCHQSPCRSPSPQCALLKLLLLLLMDDDRDRWHVKIASEDTLLNGINDPHQSPTMDFLKIVDMVYGGPDWTGNWGYVSLARDASRSNFLGIRRQDNPDWCQRLPDHVYLLSLLLIAATEQGITVWPHPEEILTANSSNPLLKLVGSLDCLRQTKPELCSQLQGLAQSSSVQVDVVIVNGVIESTHYSPSQHGSPDSTPPSGHPRSECSILLEMHCLPSVYQVRCEFSTNSLARWNFERWALQTLGQMVIVEEAVSKVGSSLRLFSRLTFLITSGDYSLMQVSRTPSKPMGKRCLDNYVETLYHAVGTHLLLCPPPAYSGPPMVEPSA